VDKEVKKIQYGDRLLFQEVEHLPNGNKLVKSRSVKGKITNKYDHVKPKYCFSMKEIELKEFFKITIGDRFEKQDFMMEIYNDYEQMRHCKSVPELMRYSEWASHFIPNTFYKWHDRSLENLRVIQWMYFDFELRKSNGQAFTPLEIWEIFREEIGFVPTIIKQSKTPGSYHVGLKHTTMNGSTESSYLFKRIQNKIATIIGTDEGAIGANHAFSLPKDGRKIFYFGDNTLDLNDLKSWWVNTLKTENRSKIPASSGSVTSLTEYLVWNNAAIQCLKNNEYDGSRNEAGFTLALLYMALGKSQEEAESFLLNEWYHSVPHRGAPYYPSALKASIKSAYSGKYMGPSKEKIEGLTGEEFNIRIYKGQYKREKLHNKNENQQAIINYFRERGGVIEMKRKELVTDICNTQESPLGKMFSYDSLNRHLDKLKKMGVIDWAKSGHGRNAGAISFTLSDGIQVDGKPIIEKDDNIYVFGKVVNLN
jgi:hypothetical protein